MENLVLQTSVRLACLRRAASVRPGPGSNPQKKFDAVKLFAVRLRSLLEPHPAKRGKAKDKIRRAKK